VSAVWWRIKPRPSPRPNSANDLYNAVFSEREWGHVFEFVGNSHENSFWLNRRSATKRASNKILQLHVAAKVGLKVPKTLISNNSKEILAFADSVLPRRIIHKTMTAYANPDGMLSYTNVISRSDIENSSDLIAVCPSIYQEMLDKMFEMRITIVGDQVFAAKIDSQSFDKAKVDWRADYSEKMFSRIDLEKDFYEKLLRFHAEMGLVYGAYDFVVRSDGSPVFLEVNPVGQWLWLEQILDLPISASIARLLVDPPHSG
jgi:glutathione synthase/RimK-type ligase-like ATP-grasp enzyme